MKTHLSGVLTIGVAFVLVASGGCVSREEYNKALTACRRANDELRKKQDALRLAEADSAQKATEMAQCNAALKARQQEIRLLESGNTDLRSSFDKLRQQYAKATQIKVPQRPVSIVLLPAQVDQALRAFSKEHPELVDYLPDYGMVKFKADFTFAKGKDDVSPEAVDALGKLTGILNSKAASGFHVYVAGHTDDIPIGKPATRKRHPTNWYLSVHRAVEVQKVLTRAGLAPVRIGVMGFGEYHAIEPNSANKKGNPKNRRVEIWIVPPGRFLTASAAAEPR